MMLMPPWILKLIKVLDLSSCRSSLDASADTAATRSYLGGISAT